MSEKKYKLPNPWLLSTIALILIFAGFIAYDKSTTFRSNINFLLGVEETVIPEGEPKQVNVTVVTDKFLTNPPYNLEEKVTQLKNELESELIVKTVDLNDEEGKNLIADYNLNTLPVLIFDENFGKTSFYEQFTTYFSAEKNHYLLRLQPFKYLKLPQVGDGQVKGVTSDSAKVTIIEYSSFTCPFCGQMTPVFDQVLKEYPNSVRFVYKHFDRGGLDPMLENASECAGEQGKFWEFHDYIFANIQDLVSGDTATLVKEQAKTLGMNSVKFDTCVDNNSYADKIANQTNEAYSFTVNGTPGIFVNDVFIGGAVDFASLKQVIDSFNP